MLFCAILRRMQNFSAAGQNNYLCTRAHYILVQFTIYRGILTGRDGHLDQSESYNISHM